MLDHLPEAERPLVQRKLRAAWGNPTPTPPLATWRTRPRAGQAAVRRRRVTARGLEQTLTVNHLGVTGSLLKTAESTNPIGSMVEIVRTTPPA